MRKPPSARSAAVAVRLAKPGSSGTLLVQPWLSLEPLHAVGRYVEEAVRRSELHHGNTQIILPRRAQVNSAKRLVK